MPTVRLEIRTESEEALKRIRQFATGVSDSFSAVKAGSPILQDSTVKVKQFASAQAEAVASTSKFKSAIEGLPEPMKRIFEVFTGVSLANVFIEGARAIGDFVKESITLGAEANRQENAFNLLTKSVGVAGEALATELKRVSGDTVNQSDILLAAARGLNEGLQPEQLIKVMEIARQQSKLAGTDVTTAFNEITIAIANQQVKALKQFGIVVDLDNALQKHADTLGKDKDALNQLGKEQALYNAVVGATENSVKALSSATNDQSERIQKLKADWADLKENFGKFLIEEGVPLLLWLKNAATGWVELGKAIKNAIAPSGEVLIGKLAREVEETTARVEALTAAFSKMKPGDLGFSTVEAQLRGTRDELDLANKALQAALKAAPDTKGPEELGKNSQAAADQVDRLREALNTTGRAEAALNAQFSAGNLTLQAMIAGLQSIILQLQPFNTGNVEVKTKIEAATLAIQKFRREIAGPIATGGWETSIDEIQRAIQEGLQKSGEQAFARLSEDNSNFIAELDDLKDHDARLAEDYTKNRGVMIAANQQFATDLMTVVKDTRDGSVKAWEDERDRFRAIRDSMFVTEQEAEAAALRAFQADLNARLAGMQTHEDQIARIEEAAAERRIRLIEEQATRTTRQLDLILREQIATAQASGNAWGVFAGTFKLHIEAAGNTMEGLKTLAAQTATAMQTAFSDLFFNLITGKFDNLKDVADNFWKAMLRAVTDFLASQAVKQLGRLFDDWASKLFGGGGSSPTVTGSASGDAGVGAGGGSDTSFWDDVLKGLKTLFNFEVPTSAKKFGETITRTITESTRSLGDVLSSIGVSGLQGAGFGAMAGGLPGLAVGAVGGLVKGAIVEGARALWGAIRDAMTNAASTVMSATVGVKDDLVNAATALANTAGAIDLLGEHGLEAANAATDAAAQAAAMGDAIGLFGDSADVAAASAGAAAASAGAAAAAADAAAHGLDIAGQALGDAGIGAEALGSAAADFGDASKNARDSLVASNAALGDVNNALGDLTGGMVDLSKAAAELGAGVAAATDAATDAARDARDAADRAGEGGPISGGATGDAGVGAGGSGSPGSGGLGGDAGSQRAAGGIFTRASFRQTIGEAGPEAVIPLNASGAQFMQEAMGNTEDTALMEEQNAILREQTRLLRELARRRGGAVAAGAATV